MITEMFNEKDLEFHYVVSYRKGFGWTVAVDIENAVMADGTVYDWKGRQWLFVGGLDSGEGMEEIDVSHCYVLQSALNELNERNV